MTKKLIQTLLKDLYEIDPKLKNHEEELIPLIETLLKNKPDMKPDKRFVAQLRKLLNERAGAQEPTNLLPTSYNLMTMKFSTAIFGAIVGALVAGPAVYFSLTGIPAIPTSEKEEQNIFAYKVSDEEPRAFGDLFSDEAVLGDALSGIPAGRGGGGGEAVGIGGGGGFATESMKIESAIAPSVMPPYPGTYYVFEYKYEGDPLSLTEENVNVLRRVNPKIPLGTLTTQSLGLLDFDSFPGSRMNVFSLIQDRKNGYSVAMDFNEGSATINQNWEQWDDPIRDCRDQACYDRYQLKLSDIPPDADIIALADEFLKQHGVDLTQYDTPQVDDQWKQILKDVESNRNQVPDTAQVIYPLQIEGKQVYEQYGGNMGLMVSVNLRTKSVSNVWNIVGQTYERSSYPAVQDTDQLLSYLNRQDNFGADSMPRNMQKQVVTITLGTPSQGLIRMYHYAAGAGQQLYVPGLIFPVEHVEGAPEYYNRELVPVPLAREMLTMPNDVFPMPMIEPAAE